MKAKDVQPGDIWVDVGKVLSVNATGQARTSYQVTVWGWDRDEHFCVHPDARLQIERLEKP